MPPCAQRAAGRFRVQYPTFPAVAVRVMTPKQQAASSSGCQTKEEGKKTAIELSKHTASIFARG